MRASEGRISRGSADWLTEVESLAERIVWLAGRVPALDGASRERALVAVAAGRRALGELEHAWGGEPC